MLYLTCTMISIEDLACYGVSRAKDWVFVDCGTSSQYNIAWMMFFVLILRDVILSCMLFW